MAKERAATKEAVEFLRRIRPYDPEPDPIVCSVCKGPLPEDGGYCHAEHQGLRFCRKSCLRHHLFGPKIKDAIIGLDLSLVSTGMIALPHNWDHDMSKVVTGSCGYTLSREATLQEKYQRNIDIKESIAAFCINTDAKHVYCEDHAFGLATAVSVKEMTGYVKTELYEKRGIVTVPINMTTARKVLLGKVPRQAKGKNKAFVIKNIRRLPMTSEWTDDQCDAFAVANAGFELAGGMAMTFQAE